MSGSSLNQFLQVDNGRLAQMAYDRGFDEGVVARRTKHGIYITNPYKTTNRRLLWFEGFADANNFGFRRVLYDAGPTPSC